MYGFFVVDIFILFVVVLTVGGIVASFVAFSVNKPAGLVVDFTKFKKCFVVDLLGSLNVVLFGNLSNGGLVCQLKFFSLSFIFTYASEI